MDTLEQIRANAQALLAQGYSADALAEYGAAIGLTDEQIAYALFVQPSAALQAQAQADQAALENAARMERESARAAEIAQQEEARLYEQAQRAAQAPVYVAPVYEEPAYVEPVYEEPVYEEPVYVEPTIYYASDGSGFYYAYQRDQYETQLAYEREALRQAQLEAQRLARLEAERLEAARLEAERLEAARLEAERLEAARLEAARLEAARLEAARLEAARLEAERLEAERLEAERLAELKAQQRTTVQQPVIYTDAELIAAARGRLDEGYSLDDIAVMGAQSGIESAQIDRVVQALTVEQPVTYTDAELIVAARGRLDEGYSLDDIAAMGAQSGIESAQIDRVVQALTVEKPVIYTDAELIAAARGRLDEGYSLGDIAVMGAQSGIERAQIDRVVQALNVDLTPLVLPIVPTDGFVNESTVPPTTPSTSVTTYSDVDVIAQARQRADQGYTLDQIIAMGQQSGLPQTQINRVVQALRDAGYFQVANASGPTVTSNENPVVTVISPTTRIAYNGYRFDDLVAAAVRNWGAGQQALIDEGLRVGLTLSEAQQVVAAAANVMAAQGNAALQPPSKPAATVTPTPKETVMAPVQRQPYAGYVFADLVKAMKLRLSENYTFEQLRDYARSIGLTDVEINNVFREASASPAITTLPAVPPTTPTGGTNLLPIALAVASYFLLS